jgi:hypothetical protein
MVTDGGDGSVSVRFFESKKLAELYEEFEILVIGYGWGESSVSHIDIESSGDMKVMGKEMYTKESVIKELEEFIDESYHSEDDRKTARNLLEKIRSSDW